MSDQNLESFSKFLKITKWIVKLKVEILYHLGKSKKSENIHVIILAF